MMMFILEIAPSVTRRSEHQHGTVNEAADIIPDIARAVLRQWRQVHAKDHLVGLVGGMGIKKRRVGHARMNTPSRNSIFCGDGMTDGSMTAKACTVATHRTIPRRFCLWIFSSGAGVVLNVSYLQNAPRFPQRLAFGFRQEERGGDEINHRAAGEDEEHRCVAVLPTLGRKITAMVEETAW